MYVSFIIFIRFFADLKVSRHCLRSSFQSVAVVDVIAVVAVVAVLLSGLNLQIL